MKNRETPNLITGRCEHKQLNACYTVFGLQVTRRWLNAEGRDVAVHLADQVVALEATLAQLEMAAGAAGAASRRRSLDSLCKGPAEAPAAAAAAAGQGAAEAGAAAAAAAGAAGVAPSGGAEAGAELSSWLAEQAAHPHGRTTTVLQPDDAVVESPASPSVGSDVSTGGGKPALTDSTVV